MFNGYGSIIPLWTLSVTYQISETDFAETVAVQLRVELKHKDSTKYCRQFQKHKNFVLK